MRTTARITEEYVNLKTFVEGNAFKVGKRIIPFFKYVIFIAAKMQDMFELLFIEIICFTTEKG